MVDYHKPAGRFATIAIVLFKKTPDTDLIAMLASLEVGYVNWYTKFKFKFFIFSMNTGEATHSNNTLNTMGREAEKAMPISLLTSGELKQYTLQKRTIYETRKLEIARSCQLFTVTADSQFTTGAIFKTF